MKKAHFLTSLFVLLTCGLLTSCAQDSKACLEGEHTLNGYYSGENLDYIAFPIGGIGAGMFCLDGSGSISHLSVKHKPEMYNEPIAFAAISVKGIEKGAKLLESQVPKWKLFGPAQTGLGSPGKSYGLPRFESGRFLARFPFASIKLEDDDIPLDVEISAWSPFIPGDADNSSLPAGAIEYSFENNTSKEIEAVFSWNSRNVIQEWVGRITEIENGFNMTSNQPDAGKSGFSVFVNDSSTVVDYCWFRGEWFDPHMILWKNIESANVVSNPPVNAPAAGASVYVPFKLKPGEKKTIAVNFCWYIPEYKPGHWEYSRNK